MKTLLRAEDLKLPADREDAERLLYSRAPLPCTVLQACREHFNERPPMKAGPEPLVAGVIV